MSSDTEQAMVKGFKEYGLGSFRHRQPSIMIRRKHGKSRKSKRGYINPSQPIDIHVATTLEVSSDIIDEYDLSLYTERDDSYFIDLRVGIEEKKCNGSVKRLSIKESSHKSFIDFCMSNALVPFYAISYPKYDVNTPTPNNTSFDVTCVETIDQFQRGYFKEDSLKFGDGFLEKFFDLYLKNYEYWHEYFDVIEISD